MKVPLTEVVAMFAIGFVFACGLALIAWVYSAGPSNAEIEAKYRAEQEITKAGGGDWCVIERKARHLKEHLAIPVRIVNQ